MKKILLVEDEVTLRTSVARGLSRLPGVEVIAVGTVAEAVTSLEQNPPDLLLSDIDLPDRSGIELLGELARRSLRCPVVFVSAYLRAYGAQIPPHAGVEVLEKPVSLETLREVVQRRLRETQEEAPFAVVDYIQLACMGRRSVRIEFRNEELVGWIAVKDGTLWTAEDRLGTGLPAFHRLAFRRDGDVACSTLREDPGPRTLHDSWESLLLDAARLLDEANRDGSTPDEHPLQLAPPLLRSHRPPPSNRASPRSGIRASRRCSAAATRRPSMPSWRRKNSARRTGKSRPTSPAWRPWVTAPPPGSPPHRETPHERPDPHRKLFSR
jgi:CheY-like chemotaxis protein